MGIEVLFKYRGYKSVISAPKHKICGEVEHHLKISKSTVNPRVVLSGTAATASLCSAEFSMSGPSSGFDLYFLQRWNPKWDTYVNVSAVNEIKDCDWLTVSYKRT